MRTFLEALTITLAGLCVVYFRRHRERELVERTFHGWRF